MATLFRLPELDIRGIPIRRGELEEAHAFSSYRHAIRLRKRREKLDVQNGGVTLPLDGPGATDEAVDEKSAPGENPFAMLIRDDVRKDAANQTPQHAWVLLAALRRFQAPGNQQTYEMAYRFHRAGTAADLRAALHAIGATLPAGSLVFTYSYIDIRNTFNVTNSLILTFLLAFSVFALGAAALIIANVVTGVVISSVREIGIMKSIGYTPAQVVQVLMGQMLLPTLLACLACIPLGVLLSRPLLSQSADAMGLPSPSAFSVPAVLLALIGLLLVVCLSAGIPAWRAGPLSPVAAITSGSGPGGHRGVWLTRRLARLRVPQAVRLLLWVSSAAFWASPSG